MFPKNAWYVACTPSEIDDKPLGRTICGERIVFYRGPEGQVAAVEDFCPHRGAPLSLGRVIEGQLVCGYHGLTMAVMTAKQLRVEGRCRPYGSDRGRYRDYPLVVDGAPSRRGGGVIRAAVFQSLDRAYGVSPVAVPERPCGESRISLCGRTRSCSVISTKASLAPPGWRASLSLRAASLHGPRRADRGGYVASGVRAPRVFHG